MKSLRWLVTPLCLAVGLFFASTAYGQLTSPQILMVGSSGAFNSMGIAAINSDPITGAAAPCGTNLWSNKASDKTNTAHAWAVDPRIPTKESGNIWVAWDNSTTPTVVCAYFSVDSIVGNRLFFATQSAGVTGYITLDAGVTSEPGDKAVPYINDTGVTLPSAVASILNNAYFNAAVSDIRPEDALYANSRALLPCAGGNCATDTNKGGEGYGPFPTGQAVASAYSNTSALVLAYTTSGADPISGATVNPGVELNIGAYPIIFFANVTKTANPGDFGNLKPANILSHDVAGIFSGYLTRTTDVTGNLNNNVPSPVAPQPLSILNREPVSGTFNTVEWQVVRNKGTVLAQEIGVNPADNASTDPANCTGSLPPPGNCGNPFYHTYADGATRSRVIGTGEMVSTAGGAGSVGACTSNGLPNALGYAFWTFSTFANGCVQQNLRYLNLDGVDPLYSAAAANPGGVGVFPSCTGSAPAITCTAGATLPNVANGSYRNWNIIRTIIANNYTAPASGPSVPALILAAQDQAHSTLFDFVPFVYCQGGGVACSPAAVNSGVPTGITPPTGVYTGLFAFRSHYTIPCFPVSGVSVCPFTGVPLNGTNQVTIGPYKPYSEQGPDMAGAVFTTQSDIDYLADTGHELTAYIQ